MTTSATVQVPAATEPQRVNKPAPSPMSAPVAQAPPPGFGDATPAAAQQQTAAAAATGGVRKNPVVVMPNKPQVSNVGVKFGSLSLGETEHAEAPAAAAAPAGSPPSAARAPVAAQPQQQQAAPQQYQQQQQQAVPQQTGFGFGFPAGMDTAAGNAYTAAYGMNADYASFYADAQRAATVGRGVLLGALLA